MHAVNPARHSTTGWDDAALADDYCDVGEPLRIDPEGVMVLARATPAAQE